MMKGRRETLGTRLSSYIGSEMSTVFPFHKSHCILQRKAEFWGAFGHLNDVLVHGDTKLQDSPQILNKFISLKDF